MVTCSQVVDGGRWTGELAEQAMKSSRPLVYDVETGSLRFSKSRAPLTSRPKSPDPTFKLDQNQAQACPTQLKPQLGKLHCGAGSGTHPLDCLIALLCVEAHTLH
jgi:hypothetical protein